jgi:cold-inducible RNA-binding protein
MSARLYVGNLPFKTTEEELRELFSECGRVEDIHLVTDRATGHSRGFGFVTMESADAAREAAEKLNGRNMAGRNIIVDVARPRESHPPHHRSGGGREFRRR